MADAATGKRKRDNDGKGGKHQKGGKPSVEQQEKLPADDVNYAYPHPFRSHGVLTQVYPQPVLGTPSEAVTQESIYMQRPARRQVKKGETPAKLDMNNHSSDYNIWYHKRLGDRFTKDERVKASTRCVVSTDSGYSKAKGRAYLCLYFARGHCMHGPNCNFYHRLPNDNDNAVLPITHDIFGRERHRAYKDDMSGVGSFERENRTLYVQGIKRGSTTEETLMKHFIEWGELEYVRILWDKAIGFVKYKLRAAAEFAKEAMTDQSLDHDEILDIRWSNEDPNPNAKELETMRVRNQIARALAAREQQERESLYQYQNAQGQQAVGYFPFAEASEAYPITDGQYADANAAPNSYSDSSKIVGDWLGEIGLEQYASAFISADYSDLHSISQVDEIGLDAIGVTDADHRGRILTAARELQADMLAKENEPQAQGATTGDNYNYSAYYYGGAGGAYDPYASQYVFTNAEYQGEDPNATTK
eukprot:TRINITY_DN5884_c0_g1_i1.p1 TRINITY_DN5884_c0_g1~~TRINITY_DN5884_c0_g1_i1.p1  ORF type:complete len:505 (+),score=121.02 TRINITY_DN5884_c0_g1_i1:91-1515(+)